MKLLMTWNHIYQIIDKIINNYLLVFIGHLVEVRGIGAWGFCGWDSFGYKNLYGICRALNVFDWSPKDRETGKLIGKKFNFISSLRLFVSFFGTTMVENPIPTLSVQHVKKAIATWLLKNWWKRKDANIEKHIWFG